MSQFPHVLAPLRVAGHLLKNRIITGPSTIHSAGNGEPYPTEYAMHFFTERARSGAGLVTCAGVSIGGSFSDGVHASWDLNVPNHTNRLAELAERIHFYGAVATMELIGVFPDGYTVCDGCSIMGGPGGREIPTSVMEDFKAGYVQSAVALQKLGYDGVLLHFGHSIPIAQFLSPYTNTRTDAYGGSLENRVRYPQEIIAAIREAVGKNFIIEVRISGAEIQSGGITQEEGIAIGALLQEHADILQVSAGMHNPDWMTVTHPCGFLPPIPNVYLADAFRKSGKIKVPISTVGGFGSLAQAEEVIAAGKADLVVMARSLIADIDLIHKDLNGCHQDAIPCIKCMRCHDSSVYGRHMQCSVNPTVGLEHHLAHMITPPTKVKRVAVVGGGPAGMKAAHTAAQRGHQVTLFEGSDSLGGALKFSDYVSFKYPLKGYKDFLIAQMGHENITLRLNTVATPKDVAGFDCVVAALGATPLVPPIVGVEHAIVATQVYGSESLLGQELVVIGGGQVGCETALHLARLGRHVTLIEQQEKLAPDASTTHRDELMVELRNEKNLTIRIGNRCLAITPVGVTVADGGREETLAANHVILAVGMIPNTIQADAFMGLTPQFAQCGDCVSPRTVEQATKEGYYAAVTL